MTYIYTGLVVNDLLRGKVNPSLVRVDQRSTVWLLVNHVYQLSTLALLLE
jgi:hypothetical protein